MRKQAEAFLLCALAILPGLAIAQSVPLTQDSWVITGNIANYGAAGAITVDGSAFSRGLVQFDLSGLPSGTVSKALLILFVNTVGTPGIVDFSVATTSWTEAGVNGNNVPGTGMSIASGLSVVTAGSYVSVDATAAAQVWLGRVANNGVLITPVGSVSVRCYRVHGRAGCDRCNRRDGRNRIDRTNRIDGSRGSGRFCGKSGRFGVGADCCFQQQPVAGR
jgi:hypothetical protein